MTTTGTWISLDPEEDLDGGMARYLEGAGIFFSEDGKFEDAIQASGSLMTLFFPVKDPTRAAKFVLRLVLVTDLVIDAGLLSSPANYEEFMRFKESVSTNLSSEAFFQDVLDAFENIDGEKGRTWLYNGKSTFIRAVSAARPKVADYPFTTLHPNLGVVRVDENKSFVIADVPGLIEGAADGAGLGIRFLKHLARTRLLLHIVDLAPPDPEADPVHDAKAIVAELEKYSPELAAKPRWLILNKLDLIPEEEREERIAAFLKAYGHDDRWFGIAAISGDGCRPVVYAIYDALLKMAPPAPVATEIADEDAETPVEQQNPDEE